MTFTGTEVASDVVVHSENATYYRIGDALPAGEAAHLQYANGFDAFVRGDQLGDFFKRRGG